MPNGRWAGSTRRARLPANWPTIRRAVLERDGHVCQLAYPGACIHTATEVDHIHGDDNHDPSALRAVCTPCHQARSSSQGGRAAAAARASRRRVPERHPGLLW